MTIKMIIIIKDNCVRELLRAYFCWGMSSWYTDATETVDLQRTGWRSYSCCRVVLKNKLWSRKSNSSHRPSNQLQHLVWHLSFISQRLRPIRAASRQQRRQSGVNDSFTAEIQNNERRPPAGWMGLMQEGRFLLFLRINPDFTYWVTLLWCQDVSSSFLRRRRQTGDSFAVLLPPMVKRQNCPYVLSHYYYFLSLSVGVGWGNGIHPLSTFPQLHP